MKFRIRVRDKGHSTVLNTHDFEGWKISHDEIMEATDGNPFYERGIVFADGDRVVQYIRVEVQA